MDSAETVAGLARQLGEAVAGLAFGPPVELVYNPLEYAGAMHAAYARKFARGARRVVFWGMNPGPWGMAQTGVPFGEVSLVRDWMGLREAVGKPPREHPKRPVEGLNCVRSEVSGRRLWGLFRERYGPAEAFFAEHYVANYCPLVFMGVTGSNLTPDKLPAAETEELFQACDRHLEGVLRALSAEWAVGVGAWAETRIRAVVERAGLGCRVARVLHPSPASPAANRDWAGAATRALVATGVWPPG